jgi:hypothetical protein
MRLRAAAPPVSGVYRYVSEPCTRAVLCATPPMGRICYCRRRMRAPWLPSSSLTVGVLAFGVLACGALAFGALASSCVRLSWQEGIACDGTSCPSGFGCCAGRCERDCRAEPDASAGDLLDVPAEGATPSDDGGPFDGALDDDASEPGDGAGAGADGSSDLACPPQAVGCFFCTPGCSCTTCAGVVSTCCLNQLQIATCGACP